MLIRTIVVLLLLIIPCNAGTYYVDNELSTGVNDGSSWANAFQSIADLDDGIEIYDVVYVKSTETPYRDCLGAHHEYRYTTIYLDATGVDNTRGTSRSKIYGSVDFSSVSWANVSGDIYKTPYDNEAESSEIGDVDADGYGIWWLDGSGNITFLTGSNPYNSTVGANEFFYDDVNNELYINIEQDPTGEHLEVVHRLQVFEVWIGMQVYGGYFQFGQYGNFNGGCYGWIIENCDFSYNTEDGFFTSACDYNNISVLNRCTFHDNGANGLNFVQISTNILLKNSCVYSNRVNGIEYNNFNYDYDIGNFLYNCTVYGNGGRGIYIRHFFGKATQLTCTNIISYGNTGDDMDAEDSEHVIVDADYNCAVNYAGKWSAGANSTTDDPEMVDPANGEFQLGISSPCIDAGTAVDVTDDYSGDPRPRRYGYDIGAYEALGSHSFSGGGTMQ